MIRARGSDGAITPSRQFRWPLPKDFKATEATFYKRPAPTPEVFF
jgi:hypothetical protein